MRPYYWRGSLEARGILPHGPVLNWRCPVAGCVFAAIYPMGHPCPLRPGGGEASPAGAARGPATPAVPAVSGAAPAPEVLGRVLAGLQELDAAPRGRARGAAKEPVPGVVPDDQADREPIAVPVGGADSALGSASRPAPGARPGPGATPVPPVKAGPWPGSVAIVPTKVIPDAPTIPLGVISS
ncbi:hypothetical protein RIF23_02205 [Lipingzhangella sp. LS1_29]|uniref:Uncharacterized protein n=1 Tax=Lipingzhangella rawalii TaxID=2055835 RepID=A0ABU2H394_9ACTN|nr:hypothetical protein [Lipingzhangella rawalii]MDS1269104.1 hypothetical protein [Lipingzhangella rawalii]